MTKRTIATLLLISLTLLLLPGCQSAQPSLSSQPTQPTPPTTAPTTTATAADPLRLSDVVEADAVGNSCLLDIGDQRIVAVQEERATVWYVYDKKTKQRDVLFFLNGKARALGMRRVGETTVLLHWYTASYGNEYRLYDLRDGGKARESGLDRDAVRFCYVGDDLYYTKQNDNAEAFPDRYSLYRAGADERPILENISRNFFVENGYLYYSRGNTVYAADRTGKSSVKVCDFPVYNGQPAVLFYRMGQWLVADYGVDAAHTYAYHTGTGQTVELDAELYGENFAADATYFYVGGAQGVYQINKQTFAYEQLCPFSGCAVCLYDGCLYFTETNDPNRLYQMELSTKRWYTADDLMAALTWDAAAYPVSPLTATQLGVFYCVCPRADKIEWEDALPLNTAQMYFSIHNHLGSGGVYDDYPITTNEQGFPLYCIPKAEVDAFLEQHFWSIDYTDPLTYAFVDEEGYHLPPSGLGGGPVYYTVRNPSVSGENFSFYCDKYATNSYERAERVYTVRIELTKKNGDWVIRSAKPVE